MYLSELTCDCQSQNRKYAPQGRLGQYEALFSAFADAYMHDQNTNTTSNAAPSSAGSGQLPTNYGMPAPEAQSPATVNPTLQTQINPQISPVFQQSYMPQNSAMNAGTSQTASAPQTSKQNLPSSSSPLYPAGLMAPPGTPLEPNFADPLGGASYLPSSVFGAQSQKSSLDQMLPWALGGVAVLGAVLLIARGRRVSVSH